MRSLLKPTLRMTHKTKNTLTIKVSSREGRSNRCLGLLQVPNDASVEGLPGWVHELEAKGAEWESFGWKCLRVTDPTVDEPRRSILAMGPRRRCCDAAAWRIEAHVWSTPDVHHDIIDHLQAFDRGHPRNVMASVSKMGMHVCDYEKPQRRQSGITGSR